MHQSHEYPANHWNGQEWSHPWATHFNPYSSRPAAAGLRNTPGENHAFDGNFHARQAMPGVAAAPPHLTTLNPGVAAPPPHLRPLEPPGIPSYASGGQRPNNVLGDSHGNVFRYQPSDNAWQRNLGNEWRATPQTGRSTLDREFSGRNMGQDRFEASHSFGSGFDRPFGENRAFGGGFNHSFGGQEAGGGRGRR